MREASSLYSQAKYQESADVVREVQQRIEELAAEADEALVALLDPVYRRVVRAHALLELEGVELPPLKPLKPRAEAPAKPPGGGVSFVKQVAPILLSKCGRCHVEGDSGGFRMADYASLMRGSAAGVVLFPGNAAGSRMVELIEVGDMPRGGLKISPDEFAILKQWIAEGAKFDGEEPRAGLTRYASRRTESSASEEKRPAASETAVSFARDVAPLFVANCGGCHLGTDRPRGGLNLTTFANAVRGGDGGPAFNSGRAEMSLLVRKVKGTADGQRMPVGRPPLADQEIATIEKWIDAGAVFDGTDPQQDIRQLAARAKAESATHAALAQERAELAQKNWALGMPSIAAAKYETENLLLLGNVGEATLADLGDKAEGLVPRVMAALGAPATRP